MIINPQDVTLGGNLFGRLYSLALQGKQSSAVWGNEDSSQSPLRVAFSVERNAAGKNKGKATIYNVSAKNRAQLVKGAAVRLRAGYPGLVATIMVGSIAKVETSRSGADIVSGIDFLDAEPSTNMNRIHASYEANTSLLTVLSDIAAAMSLTLNNQTTQIRKGIIIGIPDYRYKTGFSLEGTCGHALAKVCRPRGLDWSIQNGALNIIPRTHYDGRTVNVLNTRSGLIGVPGEGTDCVTMTSLLNPHLVPNSLVELQSGNKTLSGTYKVRKAVFTGDSHDASWQVDLETLAYRGSLAVVPASFPGGYQVARGGT